MCLPYQKVVYIRLSDLLNPNDERALARLEIIFLVKQVDLLSYEDGHYGFDYLAMPKRQLWDLIWLAHEIFFEGK